MTQKTNLNISPYYDDFDSEKNFYKVLFKPGAPVQARELTTLQSVLQGQIQSFGSHMFKEGSVIIPGGISYDGQFYAVKLNSSNSGVDISLYLKNFIGKKITGQVSGTTAKIQHVEFVDGINVDDITIYVKYIDSDNNFIFSQFQDGESLSATENVEYGNTTIAAGTPFASLISSNATSIGSAASISNGIYFVRGYFVNVAEETIVLDNYTNTPSYRVGLKVDETIVSAKEDESLYDNAKGFTNYAAPGADRFKIGLSLTKKLITDTNDVDFIELLRVKDGKIQKLNTKTQYNVIRDYLAERTYDESGDYAVNPFNPSVHNSLNNRLGNNGIYFDNEKTEQGNEPSDDLMSVKISPGKAYVRGYDVEKPGTTIIDVDKPRDTESLSNVMIPFNMGTLIQVNNVFGTPKQRETVKLYNRLKGDTGAQIGEARIYTFNLTDTKYVDSSTKYDLRLYDVQTWTKLTLNESVDADDIPQSAFIEGKSSGATGFVVYAGAGTQYIYLRQTSGNFSKGEGFLVNGVDLSRMVKEFVAYGTRNIKSVSQSGHTGFPEFSANTVLQRFRMRGTNQITIPTLAPNKTSFICTSTSQPFSGITTDTIISYSRPGFSTDTYNRVSAVASDGLTITLDSITGVAVSDVYDNALPTTGDVAGVTTATFDVFAMAPNIRSNGGLFAPLGNSNVSSIDLTGSTLTISEQITDEDTDSNGQLSIDLAATGITSAAYETFDQERYSVTYKDSGAQASIDSSQFNITNNTVTINGLRTGQTDNLVVDTTLVKYGIQSKIKQYNRSASIVISRSKYKQSGVGVNTSLDDGLSHSIYYGVRVQDEEICLNYPDVAKVVSVYESLDNSDPTLDRIQFTSTASVHTNAIIGEHIIGSTSKAIARVVSSPSVNNLEVVYLTSDKLSSGESVVFDESKLNTEVELITLGNYKNITESFAVDKGQKDEYYDYSRIVRRDFAKEPSRRLLIVFDYYSVPSTDDGDVFTVLSYDKERYLQDIPTIGKYGIRASDTLDFRPRVSVFDPTSEWKSPFDFSARNFGTSPKYLLTSNEGSMVGYDYYLPRIDKLYLDKFGKFILEKGVSSKYPKAPVKNDALMQIATINLPPYLYHPRNASISLIDNRRYTMRDIGNIEDRVENLEQVTTLSLLELDTQVLQVQDADGRNRFKSGFFVDSFKDYTSIDSNLSAVQVNTRLNELVPIVSRNSIASQLASLDEVTTQTQDFNDNFQTLDPNIQKTGDAITLKYEESDWLEQPMATTSENVNPFHVVVYNGNVELNPQNDSWVRTIQLPDNNIRITTSQTVVQNLESNINLDLGTINTARITQSTMRVALIDDQAMAEAAAIEANGGMSVGETRVLNNSVSSSSVSNQSTSFNVDDVNTRNELVASGDEEFMRSRNTQFIATNLKPSTRYYQFLDGRSDVDFVPKLIEIATDSTLNISGATDAFVVGETVTGYVDGVELIKFRVCSPRHKFGPFNNPTSIYTINPYDKTESISETYSSSSKILNVDTTALSTEAQGLYSGYVTTGMKLVGENGAEAYVKDLRLLSDNYGDVIGTFFLRNPNSSPVPSVRVETGTKTFKLTSSPTNERGAPGSNEISYGENRYTSTGTLNQWENTVTTTSNETVLETNLTTNAAANLQINETDFGMTEIEYYDPLAQTFIVGGNVEAPSDIDLSDDMNGVFLTSVDLFFRTVDSGNAPLRVQVRTVDLGFPTLNVIGKTVTLRPTTTDANGNIISNIQTSDDGSIATNVKFPEPIYLAPGREYAIVIISANSDEYTMWTAIMGEKSVEATSIPPTENAASAVYERQFALGSLFKSQNGSIWTPNQYQDLKFKLYKANFTQETGTAYFYNPDLNRSNGYIPTLGIDPIKTLSRTAIINISKLNETIPSVSTLVGILTAGRKLSGVNGKGGSATIVGRGSSVFDVSTITEGGLNYTTDSSVDTFNYVGSGSGLKLNITSVDATTGAIGVVTFTGTASERGTGYQDGDVVGIVTSTVGNATLSHGTGTGAKITIKQSGDIDTLFVSNLLGQVGSSGNEFATGIGVSYYNNSGAIVGTSVTVTSANATGGEYSGNYIKVSHFNHGMYSNTNKVILSDIESTVSPTTLSASLNNTETTNINVTSGTNFSTFEGQSVSATNPGYAKIGNEIISYNSVSGNTLGISSRGVDSTVITGHNNNDLVYKYELNGVSLRRINDVEHTVANPIGIDDYHVAINMSANGVNRSVDGVPTGFPALSFSNESSVGGSRVRSTENIAYTTITPYYNIRTPGSLTSASARIRTITGTSVSGSESSFNDSGYEPVALNVPNSLTSTRIICSKVNQDEYLSGLPRNKSLTTAINFRTTDNNLSPILHLDTAFSELRISRLDKPVVNYPTDGRVNSILNDPHSAVYVSKIVDLKNPATSLKVLLSAYRHSSADFRVLYTLIRPDSSQVEQKFQLFPGYDNLTFTNEDGFKVVDESLNSGLPDTFVRASLTNQFLDYEFTVDDLDLFTGYAIKIVMSGTNQAYAPRIRELRSIAVR